MASADLREELLCSICLSPYTDPAMLRCGHNFCRVCIVRVLETQDEAGDYSCPDCREEFPERPALMRCLALCNIVENFLNVEPSKKATKIFCTYCVDSPVAAVRSCLMCEASLCEKHLNVHSKSPEHVLSDPSTSLEKRKCSVHKKTQQLEIKKDKLSRKMRHIKELCNTLCEVITGIRSGIYVEGPADVLLDVNTAANHLLISDDLKTATWTREEQKRPETAERFLDYPQVMSRRGFTSGRHYWHVGGNGSGLSMVGMCYPSIDRRGQQSCIGDNNKSWSLWICNNRYSVMHDRKGIQLPQQISSDRFRICLDYEAGQLSFYDVCDPIRHLHTFTAAFSEPLHAALCVNDTFFFGNNWMRICR